ncbi:germinal-center associated nuclear protein-like [Phymastichus coffea]|uniref:germinal-center associated nuclear protein-like n=1 Tax=Phymastichus coffea TaxID=108790 RepID=UPI00273C26B6|nr:germinal-center associated nuclear protein-like [Phymastichus coffea]
MHIKMDKDMQVDSDTEADAASSGFVFSRPNIVPSPEKPINFGAFSDNIFGNKITQPNEISAFTFANPDIIDRDDHMEDTDITVSNTSTDDLKFSFSSKSIEETNIFGKNINDDHKFSFATQDIQTNVFARVVKSTEDIKFPLSAPSVEQSSIFSTSSQSNENCKSPLRSEEVETNVFVESTKPNKDHKSPFATQSDEQTNVFAMSGKSSFGIHNSEKTNIFVTSTKANEDHKLPFEVETTEKRIFIASGKSNEDSKSAIIQDSSIFTKCGEISKKPKSLLSTEELERKINTKSNREPDSSSYHSLDARAKIRSRNSKNKEVLNSSLSIHDLKKSEIYSRLEKNKKNLNVKLEIEKSITCTDVPDALLLKAEAKKHFDKFGETLKITIRPKRKMIIAWYATDDGALKAYNKGGTYGQEEFQTDWTTQEVLSSKPKKSQSVACKIASHLNLDEEQMEELRAMESTPSDYNLPDSDQIGRNQRVAKAKLKISRELTTKAISQKRNPSLAAKSLVKSAKIIATKPTIIVNESKVLKKEEPPSPVEPPAENKAILKISSAAIEEMQNLIQQPGMTAEERYKILDARDRLMRLKRRKQKSLATAEVTKGTCPDMCPEKERYMREFQRQVFSYEQLKDSDEYRIDHSLAVKQYSRSSADQEEPMPHDLRPVKALKLTMSYLLHEIVDLCEEEGTSLEDWYNFLWDRMRSIRKDITQQELCCLDTVELVEQCARFHILASERLCAEGTTVFDSKINSENLTKCLQSLKYMYDDLRENDIVCSNEAEFRAYVILLNLNNGTFISELRTLSSNVKHSREVKFSLDVHAAMNMNNYSRFFKLVRQTSYLNACILMRYFNEVRVKALETMVKAYCRTSGTTQYPLYELIDILGFEDEDEVFEFCHRVGLKCDKESLYIKLKRESFRKPENFDQNRAYNLVLSKRLSINQSVGECIAGGKRPKKLYENHKPYNSFNAKGYLMKKSFNAQDQKKILNNVNEKKRTKSVTTSMSTFKKPESAPLSSMTTTTFDKEFTPATTVETSVVSKTTIQSVFTSANAITTSSIFGPTHNQPSSVFSAFKPITTLPTTSAINMAVNKSLFSGTSGPQTNLFKVSPASPPTELSEQVQKVEVLSTKERTPTKRPLENSTESSVVEKKILTDKHEILKKQFEAELRLKAERERLERLKMRIMNSFKEYDILEKEVINEVCTSIVQAELERIELIDNLSKRMFEGMLKELYKDILDEQLFMQDMLIEVERRMQDRLLLKYCRAWKQWAAKRRAQRREALDNTPVWLQSESIDDCARKFYNPQQKLAIQYARENRRKSLLEAPERKKVKHAPIAFIISVGLKENAKSFDVEMSQRNFWKMVVSWPLLENRLTPWRHKKAINKYLSSSDFTQEPIFIEHKPSPHERLDICIRYFEGLICENCLTGMDALLFIIFGDEDERSIEYRLMKTILGRGKLPPIPLVIVVFGDDDVDPNVIEVSSVLENVLESGHVSEYTILYERSLDENVVLRVFQSATLWLAVNRSPAVPLEMDYLKRIFDDCLTEELWLRIQGHLSHDARYYAPLNDPNFIINLHNEAVNYLTDIIMDSESISYTDFAPELKIFLDNKRPYPCTYEYFDPVWKQSEYRAELLNITSSFIFPSWTYEWPIRDMMQLHNAIVSYCRKLLSHENSLAITSNIMADLFLIAGYNENSQINFADVLLHIMSKKISDIPGNTRVVYNKNHVKHFQTLPWWFKSNALVEYMANIETDMVDDSDNPVVQGITVSTSQIDLDFKCDINELNETCQQQEEEVPVDVVCEEMRNQISEVQSVVEFLDKQLEEQKLKNKDFEAKLTAALEDELLKEGS